QPTVPQQPAPPTASQVSQDQGSGGTQGSGAAEAGSAQLADGLQYAYLKTINAAGGTISVDVVQYFEGKAKEKAMREDGVDPAAIETSDFYFRNVNPRLRTLAVTPGARITSGLYKGGPKTVKLDQLEAQRPATDPAHWPV